MPTARCTPPGRRRGVSAAAGGAHGLHAVGRSFFGSNVPLRHPGSAPRLAGNIRGLAAAALRFGAGAGAGLRTAAAILAVLAVAGGSCGTAEARILQKDDLDRISTIKANFTTIMIDLNQSLRNQDLSGADRECVNTIREDLLSIGQELSGYENLMKIEGELNEFSDDRATVEIVRFAMARALDVLDAERKRLRQPPDHCARLPYSTGKAQAVLQIIDATVAALETVRVRLSRTEAAPRAGAGPAAAVPSR